MLWRPCASQSMSCGTVAGLDCETCYVSLRLSRWPCGQPVFERHAWAVTSPWAQSLHSHMVSLSFLQMFSQMNDRGRHSSMAEAGFRGACAEFHVAQLNTFHKYDERANFSPGCAWEASSQASCPVRTGRRHSRWSCRQQLRMLRTVKGQYFVQGIVLPGAHHNAAAFGQLLSRMWTCAQGTRCPTRSPIPYLQRPGQLHHSALAAATYFVQRCGVARLQRSDRHCCSLYTPSAYQHGRRTGLHLPVNSRRRLGGGYRCAARGPQHVRHQCPGLSASCIRGQRCPLRMPEPLQTLDACACSAG